MPQSCTSGIVHDALPKVQDYTKDMVIDFMNVIPLRGEFQREAPFYKKA